MADKQLDVLVICGSLRKGSYNAALARTAGTGAGRTEVASGAVVRKIPDLQPRYPGYDRLPGRVKAWADAIRGADGVIIVSPEYNWSIPGGLKNAIDWVSRMKDQPFKDKPVALQSGAGGMLGGSRMQYHLRQSLTSVDAILFGRPEVIVTFAAQKFDEKTLELKDQTAIDLIKQQLAGFEKFIRRLGRRDSSMGRLSGRTAIVTGGAKGIGRHYSLALAAEGARVMIADISDGKEIAEEIAAKHGAIR